MMNIFIIRSSTFLTITRKMLNKWVSFKDKFCLSSLTQKI